MWKHTLMDDTIQNLSISNSGYIHCRSQYYTAFNTLYENNVYRINHGLNELIGDIDCGTWAISYLLSMFDSVDKTTLFKPLIAYVNGGEMDLKTLQHYSCYMDISYPMFSSECTIKDIVVSAIDISRIQTTAANIREMFLINKDRFERPIQCVGNEVFKVMAAIGYSYGKQIFCFPWMSRKLFDSFHQNITQAIDVLIQNNATVILPLGK